ncbi:hypothetical protein [Streptomyces sp. S465]|uniref:hypothetical protein n=1 Tax=Streptomyces sp. S465 TaxID=2979468 RepID=UPI0022A868E1|nr:hypothetical protein [Streptomyces sp. S465]WAP61112.1 hypothetical protein N6H00_01375 [Streptomyces sp. S465]
MNNIGIMRRFTPEFLDGDTLFVSAERKPEANRETLLNVNVWQPLVGGSIEICPIDSNHADLMTDARHAARISRFIADRL